MAHFLSKKIVEDKIKSKEFKHEVINVGKVQEECQKGRGILAHVCQKVNKRMDFFFKTMPKNH